MRVRHLALPIVALVLLGCDRLTGADSKKSLDAEAIGYACRISMKTPEDCMKENETQSPTSVLFGWKEADKDIKEKNIDPSMGKPAPLMPPTPQPVVAETEDKTNKAAENISVKNEKPVAGKSEKSATEKKHKTD